MQSIISLIISSITPGCYTDCEPNREDGMDLRKVRGVVAYIRRSTGAQGGADGHRRTAAGEIGQREREDEERRAIFALLCISDDDGMPCETVQHYVQDDDSRSEVVVLDSIHIARTVNLPRETRPRPHPETAD